MRPEGLKLLLPLPHLQSVIFSVMVTALKALGLCFRKEKKEKTTEVKTETKTFSVRGFIILNKKGCLL